MEVEVVVVLIMLLFSISSLLFFCVKAFLRIKKMNIGDGRK